MRELSTSEFLHWQIHKCRYITAKNNGTKVTPVVGGFLTNTIIRHYFIHEDAVLVFVARHTSKIPLLDNKELNLAGGKSSRGCRGLYRWRNYAWADQTHRYVAYYNAQPDT